MSANNQTLIKLHKNKWYVFTNVMAESWCEWDEKKHKCRKGHNNKLHLKSAVGSYNTRDEAFNAALKIDKKEETEYGVQLNHLYKDDANVRIIE